MPSLQSFQYSYDWVGNITDITQKVGDQSAETLIYDYDEINRLTSETNSTNQAYTANADYNTNTGNLTTKAGKTLGYGAQAANCPDSNVPAKVHAAISLDGTANAYCYDLNGNMTRRAIGTGIYHLTYDFENRLTKISGDGTPDFDYVYDGDGQRVLVKQANGDKTIYIGGHFEVFIKGDGYIAPDCGVGRYCAHLPIVFALTPTTPPATAGQVWKSYYSTGSGRVMRVQDNAGMGSSGLFWLYADHLGSTTVTTRVDGTLLSTLSYTAWGETRASSGATPTSIRYTDQREAEAGLYFYQARWYDPALGRFAQVDSIVPDPGSPLGWDGYAYANNNSVNFNDPTGHYACGDGIDDPHCKQGDPVPNSTPSTPTTIVDQFGGLFGNEAQVLRSCKC